MTKKTANSNFNMSETIRDLLTENPKLGPKEVTDAILAKFPGVKINKNSFSVAFYTGRKKLGIGSPSGRGRKVGVRKSKSASAVGPKVDLAKLQAAAKFLREVGSAEAAIEAIKQVQAVQVK